MKVVINCCFGGFNLSPKAVKRYGELKGIKMIPFKDDMKYPNSKDTKITWKQAEKEFIVHYTTKPLKNRKYQEDAYFSAYDIERDDPILIKVVKELGKKANGKHSELRIVEIPDGTKYQIDEYDGTESVHEVHRSWS